MTETPAQDEVLLYPEAARLLRISERTLRRYVADGHIPHFRIDGAVRFSRTALLEMLRAGVSEAG
jgi:excisionase family DNA binding protein